MKGDNTVVYEVDLRPQLEEVWMLKDGSLATLYRHGTAVVSFMPSVGALAKIRRKRGKFRVTASMTRRANMFYPGKMVTRGRGY